MRDLIFVSMEDWDEQWRRNQFVCAELARRHSEMKILFVGVGRNFWRYMAVGDFGTIFRSPVSTVPGLTNITTTRAMRVGLERYDWGVRLNQAISRRHVRGLAAKLGLRDPILWLNPHWAVHMIGQTDECGVVYDITDDWISRDQPAWLTEQTRREDRELCQKADAVIVCSKRLQEMKQPLAGGKLHLIPNGVDAEHYRTVWEGAGPLPPNAAAWPKPVFGYTGTIHPDRLDLPLIESVARQLSAGSLVFIGQDHLLPHHRRPLLASGRIFFHDAVPYQQIPQYMRAFAVCMTPHRISPFVESLQPIKLWEYLAAGKPIVATEVSGFRDYPQLVRLARDADDFARQLQAAALEGTQFAAQRQAIARKNSWRARVDAIESVLNGIAESAPDQHAPFEQSTL
jgi:glycosyltransferase involved in cell wall biosynthesis